MLFYTFCLFILWTPSKCYCVKRGRISPISVLCILQCGDTFKV